MCNVYVGQCLVIRLAWCGVAWCHTRCRTEMDVMICLPSLIIYLAGVSLIEICDADHSVARATLVLARYPHLTYQASSNTEPGVMTHTHCNTSHTRVQGSSHNWNILINSRVEHSPHWFNITMLATLCHICHVVMA